MKLDVPYVERVYLPSSVDKDTFALPQLDNSFTRAK